MIGSAVFSEDEARPAPPDVVRAIEAQSWPDAPPKTENLGSLGSYRVDCIFVGSDILVVGVSLTLADRIIARKNITTTALIAAALAVTAGLTIWMCFVGHGPDQRVVERVLGVRGEAHLVDEFSGDQLAHLSLTVEQRQLFCGKA